MYFWIITTIGVGRDLGALLVQLPDQAGNSIPFQANGRPVSSYEPPVINSPASRSFPQPLSPGENLGASSTFPDGSPAFRSLLPSANLPPTLAKSQVSSVRKNLKLHLLSVLKHPASVEFQSQITTLLMDLGTQQAEITRNMPNLKELRKRPRDESDPTLKKMKIGERSSKGQGGLAGGGADTFAQD